LLPRSLNILFRNLHFMNLILKTKYTLSTEFVLAQVRGNNHWRTSQTRLEILNDRTLEVSSIGHNYTHMQINRQEVLRSMYYLKYE
jgi:hypothetical protein